MTTQPFAKLSLTDLKERLSDSTSHPAKTSSAIASPAIQRFWQFLLDVMTPNDDPEIWRTLNNRTSSGFEVYDRKNDCIHHFSTEQELLHWLERGDRPDY